MTDEDQKVTAAECILLGDRLRKAASEGRGLSLHRKEAALADVLVSLAVERIEVAAIQDLLKETDR